MFIRETMNCLPFGAHFPREFALRLRHLPIMIRLHDEPFTARKIPQRLGVRRSRHEVRGDRRQPLPRSEPGSPCLCLMYLLVASIFDHVATTYRYSGTRRTAHGTTTTLSTASRGGTSSPATWLRYGRTLWKRKMKAKRQGSILILIFRYIAAHFNHNSNRGISFGHSSI